MLSVFSKLVRVDEIGLKLKNKKCNKNVFKLYFGIIIGP